MLKMQAVRHLSANAILRGRMIRLARPQQYCNWILDVDEWSSELSTRAYRTPTPINAAVTNKALLLHRFVSTNAAIPYVWPLHGFCLTRSNGHIGRGGQLHPTPQLPLQLSVQGLIGWVVHYASHNEGTLKQGGCTQRGVAAITLCSLPLSVKHRVMLYCLCSTR